MLNNIFDSHAHYDSHKFDEDRDEVLKRLPSQGVSKVMSAGSDIASSKANMKIADNYDYIYFAAGVHPHVAEKAKADYLGEIEKMSKHKKMLAVGEIGLDYYYEYSPRETQQKVFIAQLKLAHQLDLPVIIHNRDAHQDTFDIVKKYRPKGIIHSFSGSVEMLEEFVKLGMYIGFTGVVTFKNARVPLLTAAATPLDRLLVETDCPYLAPVPHRGKRSDSSMISDTIATIARLKNISPQELLDITHRNACAVFNL